MDIPMDQRAAGMTPAATSSAPVAPASADVTPADIWFILRRNAVPIAVCAVAGAAAAYVYAATLPKSYTAYGAIAVQGEQMAIPQLQGVLRSDAAPDPMPFVRTEEQALGAHPLLVRITNELHLDRDPQFNAMLRPPNGLAAVIGRIKSWLPHGAAAPTSDSNDAVVNAVAHSLAITQDNRSLVIGVSFTAHDPRQAAAVVNRLIADYIAERVTRRSAADLGANAEISHRIDQVRGEIDGLEKKMQDLRTQSGMISLRAGSVSQQQLEDLATEAAKAEVQRSEIAANLSRAKGAAASGSADELASVIGSETISRLREQESEASGRAADLGVRFGPAYPALRSAQADVAAIRAQLHSEAHRIVASLQLQLTVAEQHEADVKAQLAAARREGAQAQETQAQLDQLQQDIATRRALYASLLQSAQQTVAQPRADALPDVRVLSRADVPGLPSAPNMKLAAGLGGVAGGMLAGLLGFVRAAGRSRFRNETEIAEVTGAVIIANLSGRGGGHRWDMLAAGAPAAPADDHDVVALRAAQGRLRSATRGGNVRVVALAAVPAWPRSCFNNCRVRPHRGTRRSERPVD